MTKKFQLFSVPALLAGLLLPGCSDPHNDQVSQTKTIVTETRGGTYVVRKYFEDIEILKCRPGVAASELTKSVVDTGSTGSDIYRLCKESRRLSVAGVARALSSYFSADALKEEAALRAKRNWTKQDEFRNKLKEIDGIIKSLPEGAEFDALRAEAEADRKVVQEQFDLWNSGKPLLDADFKAFGESIDKLTAIGPRIALAILSSDVRVLENDNDVGVSVLHNFFEKLFYLSFEYKENVRKLPYPYEGISSLVGWNEDNSVVVEHWDGIDILDANTLVSKKHISLPETLDNGEIFASKPGQVIAASLNGIGMVDLTTGNSRVLVDRSSGKDINFSGHRKIAADASAFAYFGDYDSPSDFQIIDLQTGDVASYRQANCYVTDLAFINRNEVALGCKNGTLIRYDLTGHASMREEKAHNGPVAVGLNSDGTIITGIKADVWNVQFEKEAIKFWDAKTLELKKSIKDKGKVHGFFNDIYPDRPGLFVVGFAGRDAGELGSEAIIRTWDVQDMRSHAQVGDRRFVLGMNSQKNNSNRFLVLDQYGSSIDPTWNLSGEFFGKSAAIRELIELPSSILAVDSDNKATFWPRGEIRDTPTPMQLCETRDQARWIRVRKPKVDQYNRHLIVACTIGTEKYQVRVWNIDGDWQGPQLLWEEAIDGKLLNGDSQDPSAPLVVLTRSTLSTRDLESGKVLATADLKAWGYDGFFLSNGTASPDGRFAYIWSRDELSRIDLQTMALEKRRSYTNEELGLTDEHEGLYNFYGLDKSGKYLRFNSRESKKILIDATTLDVKSKPQHPYFNNGNFVISDDGEVMAIQKDSQITIWNIKDEAIVKTFNGGGSNLRFAPDRSALVAGADRLDIYDLNTGMKAQTLILANCGIFDTCTSAILLPSRLLSGESTIYSGTEDGSFRSFSQDW